jgi:hypothetical protein
MNVTPSPKMKSEGRTITCCLRLKYSEKPENVTPSLGEAEKVTPSPNANVVPSPNVVALSFLLGS